jgi:3-deoxy-D-manno-octulosonate 8-phosphate phosphatase (KDO 8-P phosphatase)
MIKLFVSDIDGTLTDGSMYFSESGEHLIEYSKLDGKGFELLKENSIEILWLSAEEKATVHKKRAEQLGIKNVFCGIKNKFKFLSRFIQEYGLDWSEVAYIGDDVSDKESMDACCLSFCPKNSFLAEGEYDYFPYLMTSRKGGEGAVREAIEFILGRKGDF